MLRSSLRLPRDLYGILVHSEKICHCNFILKYPLQKWVDPQKEIPFVLASKTRRQFIAYRHGSIVRALVVTNQK